MQLDDKASASKRKEIDKFDFDVDQTLLKNRQIFDLFNDADYKSCRDTIKKLYALDAVNHSPIHLYLNNPGGYCSAGLAVIDAIRTIDSPVITIISNEVCSMGGHIAIAGNRRVCYQNSVFMAHDMVAGDCDYSLKLKDRAEYIERYYDILEKNLKKYTKLPARLIKKARAGELWLFADDMLKYGVVDEILTYK